MAISEDTEKQLNVGSEGIAQPQMSTAKTAQDAVESGTDESKKGHPWMVYLSTLVAVCGSYEFGVCVGYTSPIQKAISSDLHLSLAEYSMFGSLLIFGAMVGAITAGPIADLIGRKWTMRVASGFCAGGWLAIYFAKGLPPLYIGRVSSGYGMGVFSFVAPIYIAEVTPNDLRGALTTMNQLMICTGVAITFIIGDVLTWRALALTGIVPCAIQLFGLFFIPESPRWLEKIGHAIEFEIALQTLRGKDADISHEVAEIKDHTGPLQGLPKAKVLDLFQRRYLYPVTVGVGLMVCQQFGGINGVSFYTADIFKQAGFSASVGTITYAVLQVIVTAIAAPLVDRSGRKPLLLVSGLGLVAGCALTAVSFYLKSNKLASGAAPILAVVGILLYIAAFAIGMGTVPWVMMSEIFPINIKGAAGSFTTLVKWFGAWVTAYTFNFLMNWSSYGTFILYAATNALATIFIIFVVPETKGKTLEQIQTAMNS